MKIRYQSRCQVNAVEVADLLRDQEAAGFEHAAHLADLKRLVRVQDDVEAVVCKIQVLVIADKLDIDPFGSQSLKQQPVVPLPPFRHRYQVPGMVEGCEPFAASGSHVQQMHIRGQDTPNQVFIAPWGRFLLVFAVKIGKVPADKRRLFLLNMQPCLF